MAVYTHVSPEELARLLARYDVGTPRACKGIAEGVENSNFLVETSRDHFILTLYENRVDAEDLPFFIDLVGHLAAAKLPVPAFIADREGRTVQEVAGRPACLIAFLDGISPDRPGAQQARAVGAALAAMHAALVDFGGSRANSLGRSGWRALAGRCNAADLDAIDSGTGAANRRRAGTGGRALAGPPAARPDPRRFVSRQCPDAGRRGDRNHRFLLRLPRYQGL